MKSQELFPETLLVSREGEHIYTTSRRVAHYFGKRHKHVLDSIQKLIADLNAKAGYWGGYASLPVREEAGGRPNFRPSSPPESAFGRLNFEPSSYLNKQNKPQPEYLLSHDGFALLAMGFTGKEALRWKVAFLHEFRRMESELADHHARRIAALDTLHPNLLPTVEDYERGLPRCTTAQRLGRSVAAVTYHRRKARRLGLLASPTRAVAQ